MKVLSILCTTASLIFSSYQGRAVQHPHLPVEEVALLPLSNDSAREALSFTREEQWTYRLHLLDEISLRPIEIEAEEPVNDIQFTPAEIRSFSGLRLSLDDLKPVEMVEENPVNL